MRVPIHTSRARLFALAVLLAAAPAVSAQQQSAAADTITLVRTEVEAKAQAIQENANLDEALKSRIGDAYTRSLADLKTAEDWRTKTADWNSLRETAPQRVQELETALRDTPNEPTAEQLASTSVESLAQSLTQVDLQLADARKALEALQAESAGRVERRRQLPDLIAAARQRLSQAQAAPGLPAEANPQEAEAVRTANRARIETLEAEIGALNAELSSYEARGRLLSLRLDQAQRNVRLAEQHQGALQDVVAAKRQAEAEAAEVEARRLALNAVEAPPAIRERAEALAQRNAELAARLTGTDGLLRRIDQAIETRQRIQDETTRLETEFASVTNREEAVGLNNAVGQLLRTYRANLPARRFHQVRIQLRRNTIGEAQLEQIELQEERRGLSDIDVRIEEILRVAAFVQDASPRREEQLGQLLRELLVRQRTSLDNLLAEFDKYINSLLELNAAEAQLVERRDRFADYIDQRVLWIRSGGFISLGDLREAVAALRWIVDYRTWRDALSAGRSDLRDHPFINVVALLVLAAALWLTPRVKRRLVAVGEQAEKRVCTRYVYTVEALAYTLFLASVVPASLGYLSWRMSGALYGGEFVRVLANGLQIAAVFYASMEFPRQVLRAKGLGESHFEWPAGAAAFARRVIGRLMPVGLPILLFIALFESQEQRAWRESVGRVAFFFMMVVWAYLGYRFSNGKSPALPLFETLSARGGLASIRAIFYVLSAAAPTALAAAAAFGYYYTALRLAWRIHATLIYVFLVIVGINLAMRALLIARRRLAIEQAKRKRAELKAAQKKAKDEGGEPVPAVEVHEPEYDLSQIDAQTSRLIRSVGAIALITSLWFTWADFLPALKILDEVVLIESGTPLDQLAGIGAAGGAGEEPAGAGEEPAGTTAAGPGEIAMVSGDHFTLADLLFAFVLLGLTILAFRNLPGLLEIAVLQRLPLQPGERYAIKTVVGYLLAFAGTVAVLATLGIEWGSIQWLVAALGFGIGFGLQEIIANFISGLIILFEQPIRVGDTVTIGEVSGTVTRIRIRATTITDWDLKELVVPNKEFVTGRLINWSLSNPTLRVIVPVGVAYGSDTALVRDTLMRVAERNKRVLRQPPPQVWFVNFGDSALLFEMRVYIAGIEDWLPARDEINHAIATTFREKNIEIAFPQRDIHIRSIVAPLTVHGEPVPATIEEQ
jgi:potassium efflux system protein